MNTLVAVVALRLKLDWRALGAARERLAGLVVMTALLLAGSSGLAIGVYFTLRGLAAVDKAAALAVVCAWSGLFGILGLFGPMISRASVAESHDYSRLLHMPVRAGTLAAASLIANLLQPLVLTQLPIFLAASFAVSRSLAAVPFTAAGFAISYATILVAAQAGALASHALQRSRRYRDPALFLAVAGSLAFGLLPFVFIARPGLWRAFFDVLTRTRVLSWLPFSYGAQAAVHAGSGSLALFALFALGGLVTVAVGMAIATRLVSVVHGGELDLGTARQRGTRRALLRLPGSIGAIIEKDLRTLWRDPAMRASLLSGFFGPVLYLYLMMRQGRGLASGYSVMFLAMFIGGTSLGGGAFGMERGSLAQLFAFPVARWKMLVAKNVSVSFFKVPGFLILAGATVFFVPLARWPFVAMAGFVTLMMAAAVDSIVSIRFPFTPPRPGTTPGAYSASTASGMSRFLVSFGGFFAVLLAAAPFVFLICLPLLFARPVLGGLFLPLAFAGAAAVYALAVHAAEALLRRREADLLERVSVEARASG